VECFDTLEEHIEVEKSNYIRWSNFASGVGTSTLGKALAEKLNYYHFDTDEYYWLPPQYSFTQSRERAERQNLLMRDLMKHDNWILSGSLCGWGDIFIPSFDVVIYLWIPKNIRIKRLIQREKRIYGEDIEPGGKKYNQFLEFIEWASQYEDGGIDIRSKALHQEWLSSLTCPVVRLEGDLSVQERVNSIIKVI
jgi:adenylate kinase family enzyme